MPLFNQILCYVTIVTRSVFFPNDFESLLRKNEKQRERGLIVTHDWLNCFQSSGIMSSVVPNLGHLYLGKGASNL